MTSPTRGAPPERPFPLDVLRQPALGVRKLELEVELLGALLLPLALPLERAATPARNELPTLIETCEAWKAVCEVARLAGL